MLLRALQRVFSRPQLWGWAAEVAGVGLLAFAVWEIFEPAAAVVVVGLYLIVVANGGE